MKTLLRWLARIVAALLLLVLGAWLFIYFDSEHVIARKFDVPLRPFTAPTDADSVAKGQRLAVVYGCTSCHGTHFEGQVFFDDPKIARVVAPNITKRVREYSDTELARLVRHGVKRDGTSVLIMPAAIHMADEDLGRVIAYLRSAPESPNAPPQSELHLFARIGFVTGKFNPTAAGVPHNVRPTNPVPTEPLDLGRYLVQAACTECHGPTLQGRDIIKSANLIVAQAYSKEDFTRLLRTGVGRGNRDLGEMSLMGRTRFPAFTDEEVNAIYAYLQEFVRRGGKSMP